MYVQCTINTYNVYGVNSGEEAFLFCIISNYTKPASISFFGIFYRCQSIRRPPGNSDDGHRHQPVQRHLGELRVLRQFVCDQLRKYTLLRKSERENLARYVRKREEDF